MNPSPPDVILGVMSVTIGCLASAWCFWVARVHRNPLCWIPGIGAAIFVIGVVGQMSPSTGGHDTVWTTTASLPLIGVTINMVTVAGLLVGLLGLSLVMFFERVLPPDEVWRPPVMHPFDQDDAV